MNVRVVTQKDTKTNFYPQLKIMSISPHAFRTHQTIFSGDLRISGSEMLYIYLHQHINLYKHIYLYLYPYIYGTYGTTEGGQIGPKRVR
jgi:hypothetical protein